MATTYKVSFNIQCSKSHTCVGCGTTFSYVLARKIVGTGASELSAQKAARKAAEKSIASDVDAEPCPTCGLYQPDMIGLERKRRHGITAIVALVPLIVLFILHLTDVLRDDYSLGTASLWCALVGLVGFFIDQRNRNANLDANRQLAEGRVADGKVQVISPPTAAAASLPEASPVKGTLAFILAGAALLAAFTPELVRGVSRWPFNENAFPPVVGPGDQTVVYLNNSITSIKGYWRGAVTVKAYVAGQLNGPFLPVRGSTGGSDWGNTIHAKSSEKSSNTTLWARLHFPDLAGLSGKKIECQIDLNVTYPQATGTDSFTTQHGHYQHVVQLELAAPGAGKSYKTLWWSGFLGAAFLLMTSIFVRISNAKGLSRQALPTKVLQL